MTQATIAGAAAIVASLWLATAANAGAVAVQAVGCTPIRNVVQLQAIQNNLAGSYCLANDIDAGSIANFVPIGGSTGNFTGRLFGNGRVIRNLRIRSDAPGVGLFGAAVGALIQDVGLVNVDISGTAPNALVGSLVGIGAGRSEIRRVHVTGRVAATGGSSAAGGIVGKASPIALADSWSSASVTGAGYSTGGAVGHVVGGVISRVHATGPVTYAAQGFSDAGGLIGRFEPQFTGEKPTVALSYASGPVVGGGDSGRLGGLIGFAAIVTIERSFALGSVSSTATGASNVKAGGLIGELLEGRLAEVYSVGRVTGPPGASVGGLVGAAIGSPGVGYWDVNTSAQAASAAGAGATTAQLRTSLLLGFGNSWAITPNRSYPFLNEADIDFAAPLATLVKNRRVYTFLPIGQRDASQYAGASTGANVASLATVYTMIARAIGITRNIANLKDVEIDKYFWDDATKIATWQGPVTTRATLGTFAAITANVPLNGSNVIGEMKNGRLVILRGTYTKNNGANATHWMLGTLYTAFGNAVSDVIANDPWTGEQVMIDPATKKVVWPAKHPLTNFRIDGYQPVTLN